jgi:hypothetical protein
MQGIAVCFAYKGGKKFRCDGLKPIGDVIAQDA